MSSGSYMPEPVLQVEIPKSSGGKRPLGIPTILDRIAQMTVVMQITPRLEAIFHQDSYGYRPAKSAHDAIGKARERCFKYGWVLDMDISKFFDTIDHFILRRRLAATGTDEELIRLIMLCMQMGKVEQKSSVSNYIVGNDTVNEHWAISYVTLLTRINRVFDSIASQLAKENKKFQFSKIEKK